LFLVIDLWYCYFFNTTFEKKNKKANKIIQGIKQLRVVKSHLSDWEEGGAGTMHILSKREGIFVTFIKK
jgi:hypothetical protein